MYEKVKLQLMVLTIVMLLSVLLCSSLSFASGTSSMNQQEATINNTLNTVERIESKQRESLELNRSIQRSIDRSTELSHEAKERVDRSTQYNQQIGERIDTSKASINEARDYLKRNAELFDRIERANRE